MPSRSLVIQLQPGVQQAILPDHRKMLPGIQYVIDWDTFQKLSIGARQNIIQVVTVNSDSTAAATSFVPAQTSTGVNTALNLQTILTQVSTTPTTYSIAGFAAQGYDAGGTAGTNTGVGPTPTGAAANQVLTGPAGERYEYVYNPATAITSGQVAVWADEVNRFVTSARPTYTVVQDGQGTEYVASVIDNNTTPATVGTKQGRFAGVALVTIPSGNYGWVQIEGFCPYVSVSGVVAAGATLAVAPTTGTATTQLATTKSIGANNVVTGTPLANNVFATALTSGTNTFIQVHIRSVYSKPRYMRSLNKN